MKRSFTIILATLIACFASARNDVKSNYVKSPDGRVEIKIETGNVLSYTVSVDGNIVLGPSPISMTLEDGTVYGGTSRLRKVSRRSVDQTLEPMFYRKSEIRDNFNEMSLRFDQFELIARAYDDGAAYRFVSRSKTDFKVVSELADIVLPADDRMWVTYVKNKTATFEGQFHNSHENIYDHIKCSEWDPERISISPLAIEKENGLRITICEADLLDYPGMYFNVPDGKPVLRTMHPGYPKEYETLGTAATKNIIKKATKRENYIAQCSAGASFPWRVAAIARNDAQMTDADMIWRLATPADDRDWSWVKPGQVAWDWWCKSSLTGVDFKTGFNTATYKYFVDFAAEHGIPYFVIDGGWSVRAAADLMQVVPETDMQEVVSYANSKNVGIILWAGYWPFHRDMEKACKHYSEMGVKGFKVDFHDRDDQPMIQYYKEAAEMAAKYHLILDFHGCSKPAGLQRTYPNVLSFEAVYGLEHAKFTSSMKLDLAGNELVFPFLRMQAGPVDYTSGAMRNATRENFRNVDSEPMSQGTRTRQLAHFVLVETPVPMLCDSPSQYAKEPECLDYLNAIPVTWDETVPLDGKIGEYLAIARRSGNTWYVAAMCDWNGADKTLDLSFLPEGKWMVDYICDGANADKNACDYSHRRSELPADRKIDIHLAPAGGYIAKITAF